jgi:hypothetical protein
VELVRSVPTVAGSVGWMRFDRYVYAVAAGLIDSVI